MIHLGPRVSALLDGRLSAAEEERAWAHVHTCGSCRAAVEREGWVKRELAGLSDCSVASASAHLKGALHRGCDRPREFAQEWGARDRIDEMLAGGGTPVERSGGALVGAGSAGMSLGVSMGVAVIGMLALSAPAQAPAPARPLEPVRAGLSGTSPAQQTTGTSGTSTVGRAARLQPGAIPAESVLTANHASARYRVATHWMRNPL